MPTKSKRSVASSKAPKNAPARSGKKARSAGTPRQSDAAFATTLAKGLAVLEAFAPESARLGNTEIAQRTGLSRPTVARLTHTLAELGYLAYEPSRAKFRLWARALTLAHPLLASMTLRQRARPLMQDLANSVRGTVSIGLLDGTSLVYVESARAAETVAHTPDIGSTIPLPQAAMGRALLSMLDADELASARERDLPPSCRRYGAPIARRCATACVNARRGSFACPTATGSAKPTLPRCRCFAILISAGPALPSTAEFRPFACAPANWKRRSHRGWSCSQRPFVFCPAGSTPPPARDPTSPIATAAQDRSVIRTRCHVNVTGCGAPKSIAASRARAVASASPGTAAVLGLARSAPFRIRRGRGRCCPASRRSGRGRQTPGCSRPSAPAPSRSRRAPVASSPR